MKQTDVDREQRLAQALRANLARRKARARGQVAAAEEPRPADQRASAIDPSDVAAPAA